MKILLDLLLNKTKTVPSHARKAYRSNSALMMLKSCELFKYGKRILSYVSKT